ncbi:RHS repeat-associated core domain-containing protein [Pseudomonas faucium]|uniref:RHS repeat-associated core domain-containing protein n=2 Tax=Pseudomonas faucium TaxID=2740518 RepID=UPI0039C2A18B
MQRWLNAPPSVGGIGYWDAGNCGPDGRCRSDWKRQGDTFLRQAQRGGANRRQAGSHRFTAMFDTAVNLWERACPAKRPVQAHRAERRHLIILIGEEARIRGYAFGSQLIARCERGINMPSDKTDRTTLPHQSNWRSAISATPEKRNLVAYTAYGFSAPQQGLASSLGFNGERLNLPAGGYFLGNGYRLYNPQLMRFLSSDDLSPFGRGGINAYSYCAGDPVNKIDPSGHAPMIFRPFVKFYRWVSKRLNSSPTRSQPPIPMDLAHRRMDSVSSNSSSRSMGSSNSSSSSDFFALNDWEGRSSSSESFDSNYWGSSGRASSSSRSLSSGNSSGYRRAAGSRQEGIRTMHENMYANVDIQRRQGYYLAYQRRLRNRALSNEQMMRLASQVELMRAEIRDLRYNYPNHEVARNYPVTVTYD